jgi:hypothetical protein
MLQAHPSAIFAAHDVSAAREGRPADVTDCARLKGRTNIRNDSTRSSNLGDDMHWRSEPCLALWCLFAFAAAPVYADDTQVRSAPETALQVLTSRPWTGDLDGMIKRRMIRVLVVNSKTFVFVDKGTQRGITHEVFKACENDLDKMLNL